MSAALPLDARTVARAALVCTLGFLYIAAFWYEPAQRWPVYATVYAAVFSAMARLSLGRPMRWAVRSWAFVLAAVGLLAAAGRSLRSLGLTRVAPHGWRLFGVAFALALPAMIWVGLQTGVQRYYARIVQADGWQAVLANALVMVSEHVILEGVILALALPGGALDRGDEDPPRRGRLAKLGFGLPEGQRGVLAWLGVPAGAWPALLCSAVVFGLVHTGKVTAELAAAFPGGLGLAVLTYRVRAVWPGLLLHLGSGTVILGVAMLARG